MKQGPNSRWHERGCPSRSSQRSKVIALAWLHDTPWKFKIWIFWILKYIKREFVRRCFLLNYGSFICHQFLLQVWYFVHVSVQVSSGLFPMRFETPKSRILPLWTEVWEEMETHLRVGDFKWQYGSQFVLVDSRKNSKQTSWLTWRTMNIFQFY